MTDKTTQGLVEDLARLRGSLIEMGRMIPGVILAGDVSTDFLMHLPAEMAAWIRRVTAENDRLSKAVMGGILPDLLDADETDALVDFVKTLRASASPALRSNTEDQTNG